MKRIIAGLGTAVTMLGVPAVASAQVSIPFLKTILNPIQPTNANLDINTLFQSVFNIIITIAAMIAVLYLVWAGIQYITASTDEDKAKKAKTAIFNAIIGIVVIILSYAIIVYVGRLVRTTAPGTNESNQIFGNSSNNPFPLDGTTGVGAP